MKTLQNTLPSNFSQEHWKSEHVSAVHFPEGFERPIVKLWTAWTDYAMEYQRRYEQDIWEDYILGDAWRELGQNLLRLLDGDIGRLDAGIRESVITENLSDEAQTNER